MSERSTAPAWNEGDKQDEPLFGPDVAPWRLEDEDGTPVTNYASKTVMLQAGRKDSVVITDVMERFDEYTPIPDEVSVVKRTATYYGPDLLVHAEIGDEEYNYTLTAPGPGAHLLLWAGDTEKRDGTKWRSGWYVAAEVQAEMAVEQRPYETCGQCGELIRTIYHDRMASIGECDRASSQRVSQVWSDI